jgi:hypothetical protein
MGVVADLLKDAAKNGPGNIQKVLALGDTLPKDKTLEKGIVTFDKLLPYLPMLEKAINSGELDKLEKLAKKLPDQATLKRLIAILEKLAPYLDKLPDEATLKDLMKKIEPALTLLENLDKE